MVKTTKRTKTRLNEDEGLDIIDQTEHILQYKCNLYDLVKLLKQIKLSFRVEAFLGMTPFSALFSSLVENNFDSIFVNKYENNVENIIRMYDPVRRKFRIGGKFLTFTPMDIALIFGIPFGEEDVKIPSYATKPTSSFINRRFSDVTGMVSTNVIKNEAIKAASEDSLEGDMDVCRLLCLFTIGTLLFPTRGVKIRWAFFNFVEDIEYMGKYNWPSMICRTLVDSIHSSYTNPGSVTGCVISLLYWLCEHTTIMQPESCRGSFPRYQKWSLTKLSEQFPTYLHVENDAEFEVNDEMLLMTNYEQRVFGVDEIVVAHDVGMGNVNVGDGGNNDNEAIGRVDGEHSSHAQVEENNVLKEEIQKLEDDLFKSDIEYIKMCKEIEALKSAMVNMVEDHRTQIEEKVRDIEWLNSIINDLTIPQAIGIEDELTLLCERILEMEKMEKIYKEEIESRDGVIKRMLKRFQEVHGEKRELEDKVDEVMVHRVERHIEQLNTGAIPSSCADKNDKLNLVGKEGKVVEGSLVVEETPYHTPAHLKQLEDVMNSMVKGIKQKGDRKVKKSSAYEYNSVGQGKRKRMATRLSKKSTGSTKPIIQKMKMTKNALTKKGVVGRYMEYSNLQRLRTIYNKEGLGAMVREGQTTGETVFVKDLLEVLDDKSIASNVVDAYAGILKMEDEAYLIGHPEDKLHDNPYFFTSLCWTIVRDNHTNLRKFWIEDRINIASHNNRWLFFPMNSSAEECMRGGFHFHLLVYDTHEGHMLHYNPYIPDHTFEDCYFSEATKLRDYIVDLLLCRRDEHLAKMRNDGQDTQYALPETQEYKIPIIKVEDCPQQDPKSLDCGVAICYFMEKIYKGEEIKNSISRAMMREYRAKMIDKIMGANNI